MSPNFCGFSKPARIEGTMRKKVISSTASWAVVLMSWEWRQRGAVHRARRLTREDRQEPRGWGAGRS